MSSNTKNNCQYNNINDIYLYLSKKFNIEINEKYIKNLILLKNNRKINTDLWFYFLIGIIFAIYPYFNTFNLFNLKKLITNIIHNKILNIFITSLIFILGLGYLFLNYFLTVPENDNLTSKIIKQFVYPLSVSIIILITSIIYTNFKKKVYYF